MANVDTRVSNWTPVAGRWSISPEAVRYEGPQPQFSRPFGICVAGKDLTDGCVSACVRFSPKRSENAAQLLFGYQSLNERYVMAGIGGWEFAYSIGEHEPGVRWRCLAVAGHPESLSADQEYEMSVTISGQRIRLTVDGVRVLNHVLDKPLTGGVGLFAFGEEPVEFSKVSVDGSAGMQIQGFMGKRTDWQEIRPLGAGGQSEVTLVRRPARVAERAASIRDISQSNPWAPIVNPEDRERPSRLASAVWGFARPETSSELGAMKVFKLREAGPQGQQQAIERLKSEIAILQQGRSY